MPVGLFEFATYSSSHATLKPGDTLVLYSDGVTEAHDIEGDEFGEERLIDVLEAAPRHSPPAKCCSRIVEAVQDFARGAEQNDDVTALVVRYLGPVARQRMTGVGSMARRVRGLEPDLRLSAASRGRRLRCRAAGQLGAAAAAACSSVDAFRPRVVRAAVDLLAAAGPGRRRPVSSTRGDVHVAAQRQYAGPAFMIDALIYDWNRIDAPARPPGRHARRRDAARRPAVAVGAARRRSTRSSGSST